MRAALYSRTGPARDVLSVADRPQPAPAPGEVRVRLAWSGVNPSDVKSRAGTRSKELPYPEIVPHSDGAGVIDAVGDGVPRDRIGERVWIWNGAWGRAHGTAAEWMTLARGAGRALARRRAAGSGREPRHSGADRPARVDCRWRRARPARAGGRRCGRGRTLRRADGAAARRAASARHRQLGRERRRWRVRPAPTSRSITDARSSPNASARPPTATAWIASSKSTSPPTSRRTSR